MTDQFITCPNCGTQSPLTHALRAEIETTLLHRFEQEQRELQARMEEKRLADLELARAEADSRAQQRVRHDILAMQEQLAEQAQALSVAREQELALRRRERELERQQRELELSVERRLEDERRQLVAQTQERAADEHRLKDAEKDRQLAELRRQIEDLRRKADQGSQQRQGEAGEGELEAVLREVCRIDDIRPVSQGVRGADLHHTVLDARGRAAGLILWECKNTRAWSDAWIPKLKVDQRAVHAEFAVLVTACLPKGVSRFGLVDGVLVTDFASVGGIAAMLRLQLIALAQARHAALHKEERLELLHRYLTGTDFRHRVEAIVEAFTAMKQDLDQERRAAERQWSRRARQLEAVTCTIACMYGDLQGLLPALSPITLLQLPADDDEPQQEVA